MCLPSQHPIREGNPTQHRTIKRRFDHGVSASSVTKKRVCPSITRKVDTQRTFGDGVISLLTQLVLCEPSRPGRPRTWTHIPLKLGYVQGSGIHGQSGAERDRNKETCTRKRNTSAFRRTKPSLIIEDAPSHLPASTGRSTRAGKDVRL